MSKKKSGSNLSEKRRIRIEKKKRTTDIIAYTTAALAVAAIIGIVIFTFCR